MSFVLIFFSTLASAENPMYRPLFFQADKNGAQILPQKFEYTLIDAEKIRIGDILIDSSTFTFHLLPVKANNYQIKFNWPAGILTAGQLILKNNNGKALWKQDISASQIKITPVASDNPHLRAELAEYTLESVDPALINTLKYLPFVNFCISSMGDHTKVYLCSKERYVSSTEKELVVKDRKTTEKTASVEINGKRVGPQGIIILNNREENIYFKSLSESGSSLEIETRMKDVDFKDLVLSPNGEILILTASGTEPADASKVKKLGDNLWQIEVPANRPIIYLKGDGGVPLRQEFFMKGEIPKEAFRPMIALESPEKVFSSSVSLKGLVPAGVRLKAATAGDGIRGTSKAGFQWDLRNLRAGTTSRHYLSVDIKNKSYFASYDIYRGTPYVARVGLQYQTPSSVTRADVNFQMWFEKIITAFHWGLELDANLPITAKAGYPEYNQYRAEILYRFSAGFPLQDATWGLGLPFTSFKGKDISSTLYGLSFWGLQKPPAFAPSWVQWYKAKVTYLTGNGLDNTFKLTSSLDVEVEAYTNLSNKGYLTYGPGYRSLTWDPTPVEAQPQIFFNVGYLLNF